MKDENETSVLMEVTDIYEILRVEIIIQHKIEILWCLKHLCNKNMIFISSALSILFYFLQNHFGNFHKYSYRITKHFNSLNQN